MPHLLGEALQRARFTGEVGAIVNHRDLRRGCGKILDCVLLEQMHRPLPDCFADIIDARGGCCYHVRQLVQWRDHSPALEHGNEAAAVLILMESEQLMLMENREWRARDEPLPRLP